MPPSNTPHVFLFFTWDVSLKLWQDKGLLAREIRLYQELVKRGVAVTFLTWGDEADIKIGKTVCSDINIIPLYTRIPRPKNKALRALCSLLVPFKIRTDLKSADLLKTNQMWGGWVAVLTKLLAKKPLLVRTGFELYDFTCRQEHSALRRFFIRLISQITYKNADHIFLATHDDAAFVQKTFGIGSTHITLQPNWIDTEIFKPLEVKQHENKILFVGRLNAQKNLYSLIRAIAATPYTLDIIGQGELEDELKHLAQGLNASVNFLGRVANDELPQIYNQYPVYILPSHYEGNPKTLLEAMACGCAVIGADVTGIAPLIKHEQTGLLCAPDEDAIAKAIARAFSDTLLCKTIGRNARQYILDNHTLDRAIARELKTYDDLAGKNV